ncbi:MAG: glycosyl hydrolase [Chloroflexota bacterium]|nr:glycosyl hydrolase [Chloroflexota bacterium]MDE3193707.1 glycosyl hydrolase [Chloroflexota bacterium]
MGWDDLEFRLVGPFRGGRVGAVAGHPTDRLTFYMGSTGGGVWKTTDAGRFWENVSDKYFKRASVGAIAVAASDSNVVYVGMGESCIRENVSHGDGVYKTTDGGRSWKNVGLGETRNISTVCVDPRDANVVYVAALGHAHGRNRERGVFRSRDGGATWQRVLFRDERTGAIDLSMDPNNPRILYAALWETVRLPHTMISGGPGSGIFKTTDGGDTWTELTKKPGFPSGVLGKVGIAVAPSRPDRVYALVEANDGGVYRSDDAGESWTKQCEDRNLRQRAWYYMHVFVDPRDADTVWVLNVDQWRSIDAGKTFQQFEVPHGDNHDLWIDPNDPQRMIQGNDGGATVTLNGGKTWSTLFDQPTAELYHVVTDTRFPYRMYGTQQDNTAIAVPSRARIMGITDIETYDIGGGEAGWVAVRPDDPDVVYCGNYQGYLTRYDHRIGQSRNIAVWPEPSSGHSAADVKYRFQWTSPTVLSPHDPNTLYTCGNFVFRSHDEGQTWERISGDLTRNDPSKTGPSGGPITRDQTGAEYYCTIFAFAESPVRKGLLWAGSDDGLIHVSPDDGRTWKKVTPRGLPAWSTVSAIEASPHDANTAYAAMERHMLDDFQPLLYKTTDLGRTWTKITAGIPDDDFCRVIREDVARRGVLYAGTETGLYVSHDAGRRWRRVQANLPHVPIHDIAVRRDELVLATHGRSFWALDDIAPLREWRAPAREAARLFPPPPAYRVRAKGGFGGKPIPGRNYRFTDATMITFEFSEDPVTGDRTERYLDAGKNPPDGAIVHYWLRERPAGEVKLSFHDGRGRLIREFTSRKDRPEEAPIPEAAPAAAPTSAAEKKEPRVKKEAGLNRFVWNLRYPDATRIEGDPSMDEFERALAGPQVAPGKYQVRLNVGDETLTQDLEVRIDPRVPVTPSDLREQLDLLLRIRDKISRTHDAINTIRTVRRQVEEWEARSAADRSLRQLARAAADLRKQLRSVEEELIQWRAKSRQDTLNWPVKLNGKLGGLASYVAQADARPTNAQVELYEDLAKKVDAQLARLAKIMDADVKRFASLVRSAKLPPIASPKEAAARKR